MHHSVERSDTIQLYLTGHGEGREESERSVKIQINIFSSELLPLCASAVNLLRFSAAGIFPGGVALPEEPEEFPEESFP